MSDPVLVGLAERVRALELLQEFNLRAIEQRLAALEAAVAPGASERVAQDLRELAARRGADGRHDDG